MEPELLRSRNFYVEKHNLVLVGRFVIKSVIDKASVGDIEEDSPEVINLLATIEHILNHHAKASRFGSGYGTFWSFMKESTAKLQDSSIAKVLAISLLKNSVTRGRAWLRLALMEKRLAEYLKEATTHHDLLKKYYTEGAIVSSEEMQLLIADVIGLESIDFNFCLRNMNVNLEGGILVDYSPYLRFVHCKEGIENDLQEIQDSTSRHSIASAASPLQSEHQSASKGPMATLADSDLKERLAALQRAFRTSSEQKGYLEQMMKRSEQDMAAKQAEHQNVLQERNLTISKLEADVKQLESVVLELQSDLSKAKLNNKEMQSVITHLYKRINSSDANDRALATRIDNNSVNSDMSMDELTLREDNSSLRPLVGSLASEPNSLTSSYDRGKILAETASLSASYKNLSTGLDMANGPTVTFRRLRATSELSQETTSKYLISGQPAADS